VKTLTLKQITTKLSKVDYIKLGEKIIAVLLLVTPFSALADLPQPGCGQLSGVSCTSGGANDLIVNIINILLGIAFLVAVLMLIIGGFRYIFDAGNEKGSAAGKKTVINALIGLVIIILSYVIVQVVAKTVSSGSTSSPS
jgi:hypothetical protein